MASGDHPLASEANFQGTAAAFTNLTDAAAAHSSDPKSHLHLPSHHPSSHGWLKRFIPTDILHSLEARHHMGNYVIDRKTGAKIFEPMSIYVRLGMHLLYYGSLQDQALHWQKVISLLEEQSVRMGKEYDDPASKAHIVPFIESFELQDSLQQYVKPDPTQYATFNEFFAREIKPEARPVDEPGNELVVSSPADCRLTAFPTIDMATQYWVKGTGFTLEKLFGDSNLAREMDGGSMVIARLAPQDYHRWHSPVSGTVEAVREIAGAYYTVNPQAINQSGTLDVFCENRRSVMTLKRKATGRWTVVIAVGAMLVGSIKYVDAAGIGKDVERGQCLGAFYYGGSTVIVVYPKGEVTLDEDLVKNSIEQSCETTMLVGGRTGISSV